MKTRSLIHYCRLLPRPSENKVAQKRNVESCIQSMAYSKPVTRSANLSEVKQWKLRLDCVLFLGHYL